jgi:DNA-binding XRE family transcriptional regulator
MRTKTWKEIKDEVYGKKGTDRRDELDREFDSFRIGLLLKNAREEKHLTQQQLGDLVDKKRTYISKIENDGGNMTLKTLYEIVEKGFGGKLKISIYILIQTTRIIFLSRTFRGWKLDVKLVCCQHVPDLLLPRVKS